jgi:hypothetical protein
MQSETPTQKYINIVFCLLLGTLLTSLFSCRCSCDCRLQTSCCILTVKNKNTDSLILTQKYCTTKDLYTDKTFQDSIDSFYAKHNFGTTTVIRKDSIKTFNTINNLKCDETDQYEKIGYNCSCYK